MKKIFTLLVLVTFCLLSNTNLKSQTPLLLDYSRMDSVYTASNINWSYDEYLWDINKNLPPDSSLNLRFAAVFYDSLINFNYSTGTSTFFPLATSTVRLDSFYFYYNHIRNNTASTDTIYLSVFNISQATITGNGANAVFSAPWLWRDSIKINGTANANTQGTQIFTNLFQQVRRPNLTLPLGQSFGIYIEFRGNIANKLQVLAGMRDECSATCAAAPAFNRDNSLYYLLASQGGTNFSGINPIYYDCDASGTNTVGACEEFYTQNFWIPAYVTRTGSGPQPPTVVTTAASSIAQTTATINGTVNANGNTASVSFEWGLTTAYGNSGAANPASVSGSSTTAVLRNLTGLTASTTYHYRVNATNSGGTTNGNDMTFTTLPAGGACTPDGSVTSGISPAADQVPCLTQGVSFSQTYTFVIPSTVFFNGQTLTIQSIHFDSLTNLPAGINYFFDQNPATYSGGQRGCVLATGTTNATCGQYQIRFYGTVNVGIPVQTELTGFLQREYLRVIGTGNPCPAIDTTQSFTYLYGVCGASSLSVTATKTNVNCFGQSTGSVTATPSGGTAPYTYLWNNNATTATINNLTAGTYTVTVTDNVSATATASVSVTQPNSALSVSTSSVQAACGQNNGSATASVTGGTGGYTYSWSNGGSTATISNVAAGGYSVTVMDANACTATASVTVTTPASFTLSVTTVNVLCYGQSTGSATAVVTGGTGLGYAWSNSGNTSVISNLPAGTYTVTVTDGNGCVKTASGTVTQPVNPLTATASSTPSSCGSSTGTATVTVTNNNGTPTYVWNPGGGTTSTISGLAAGNYSVTVTAGGCTATVSVSVNNSNGPSVTIQKVDPTCFGSNNGSATALVSGGSSPYTYLWSNNATGSSVNGLTAGNYTLIVTDNGGCSAFGAVTLVQPNPLTLTETVVNVNCNGAQTGSISLTVGGGTGPYIYGWSNSSSSSSISNLSAANYSVTVTDSRSCTAASTYTVTQPTALNVTTSSIPSSGTNGSATATVSGGTSPYNYTWSGTPTQTTAVATALVPGSYSVTVTDTKGCSATSTVTVILVGIHEPGNEITSFLLFPNPATDVINVVMELSSAHSVQLNVTDINGKVIYTSKESANGKMNREIKVSDFAAGVYFIEAIADKQVIRRTFNVTR